MEPTKLYEVLIEYTDAEGVTHIVGEKVELTDHDAATLNDGGEVKVVFADPAPTQTAAENQAQAPAQETTPPPAPTPAPAPKKPWAGNHKV